MRRSLILVFLLLVACHSSGRIEGTYSYAGVGTALGLAVGSIEVTFKPDGVAIVSEDGLKSEWPYSVEGNDIKIATAHGTRIFTRQADGSLASGSFRLVSGALAENRSKISNGSLPRQTEPAPPVLPASTADSSTPLERYVVLDPSDVHVDDLVYLYFALGGTGGSSDEELRLLSAEYANENDAFKKRDIADKERPRIQAEKEKYKSRRYFALATHSQGVGPSAAWQFDSRLAVAIKPYDLDKKGFALNPFSCTLGPYRTARGIVLQFRNPTARCFIPVPDEDQAKKLEAARASGRGVVHTVVYAYAESAGNGTLDVTPTAMTLTVVDGPFFPPRPNPETIAEFKL